MDCVIGIDGGGTRSTGLCVDLQGRLLARADGGSLNYNAASVDEFRQHLSQLIDALKSQAPGALVLRYVIGTAALFDYATDQDTQRACAGVLPYSNTCLIGDAVVALYGATAGQPGVLIISGTGSIAVSFITPKQFRTAGGFGPLIGGDPGSAFWMASQSILSAAQEGEDHPLARAICKYFGVAHLHDVIGPVYHQRDGCRRLAGLTEFLAGLDLARDNPFAQIQQRAGQELAAMAEPLFRTDLGTMDLVYGSGSVLQKNDVVRGALEKELSQRLGRDVRVQQPQLSAASGAVLLALEQAGATITESIRGALREEKDIREI